MLIEARQAVRYGDEDYAPCEIQSYVSRLHSRHHAGVDEVVLELARSERVEAARERLKPVAETDLEGVAAMELIPEPGLGECHG